jgi:hypothetical protein
MTLFLKLTCQGPLFGVIIASVVANVSSPKEGAILGALIPIPLYIYSIIPAISNVNQASKVSSIFLLILAEILGSLLALGLVSAVGALIGLGIGKFLQSRKKGNSTIF